MWMESVWRKTMQGMTSTWDAVSRSTLLVFVRVQISHSWQSEELGSTKILEVLSTKREVVQSLLAERQEMSWAILFGLTRLSIEPELVIWGVYMVSLPNPLVLQYRVSFCLSETDHLEHQEVRHIVSSDSRVLNMSPISPDEQFLRGLRSVKSIPARYLCMFLWDDRDGFRLRLRAASSQIGESCMMYPRHPSIFHRILTGKEKKWYNTVLTRQGLLLHRYLHHLDLPSPRPRPRPHLQHSSMIFIRNIDLCKWLDIQGHIW